jgi:alpha-mannosidase
MIPQNGPISQIPNRIRKTLERLEAQIWQVGEPAVAIEKTPPQRAHIPYSELDFTAFTPVELPYSWGPKYTQCWFRVTLPTPTDDRPRFFEWHDHGEATLYIGGVPYYGIDPAHRKAPLPAGVTELLIESTCLCTGIWVEVFQGTGIDEKGSTLTGANLAYRNEEAWEVYHDFKTLRMVLAESYKRTIGKDDIGAPPYCGRQVSPLNTMAPVERRLLRRLDDAINAFDLGGLDAMKPVLKSIYREFPADATALDCVLTGHAHIDLVWLWPESIGEAKAVHTFSTANTLMKLYPEFRFSYTQPASYRAVQRRSPELYAEVQRRIADKQWEATGAGEVECDTQLACGEALARCMLLGQDGFRAIKGDPSSVLWLPDCFGYSACIPQILQQVGVDYFFTTKLTWSEMNAFPFSTFIWTGHDGSEVLCHVTQGHGYNCAVKPEEHTQAAYEHRQSDINPSLLLPTGYGDGGGGVNEEMLERARRLQNIATQPKARWGFIEDYYAQLEPIRDRLPKWKGELYLEYHRGVQTTHGDLKHAFRSLERSLQAFEAVRCAQQGSAIDVELWRRLVFAQFHDYIPGSSIHEVYQEHVPELTALAAQTAQDAATELSATPSTESLFNPLPFARPVRHDGKVYLLPPLTGEALEKLAKIETTPVTLDATTRSLQSDRIDAKFDALGCLENLVIDGHPVAFDGPGGALLLHPDNPSRFDAWDIDRPCMALAEKVTSPALVETTIIAADVAEIAFTQKVGQASTVKRIYRLEAGSSVLKLRFEIDWQDTNALLKVAFATDYRGQTARYGAPFGSTLRSVSAGPERTETQWEVPASRYAIISDDTESDGLFIVTEAKYGFSCYDGTLACSLLRSVMVTEAGNHATIRDPFPNACSDIGAHTIELAVGHHNVNAPRAETPVALADSLYTAAIPYAGAPCHAGLIGLEGGDSLHPAWAKPEGTGSWVLRLTETAGRRGEVTIRAAADKTLSRVDLSGNSVAGGLQGHVLSFKPYELISIRFDPRNG